MARYHVTMLTKFTKLLLAAALTLPLSGCIAWEIRDEIRTTNQHLCEVTPALGHTIAMVEETNTKIAETNAQLGDVQAALAQTQAQLTSMYAALRKTDEHLVAVGGTLVETNPKLNDLDGGLERMKILNEMHATLKEVNATLGPLNKAMGSLGGAVSFLGISGGSQDLLATEDEAAAPTSAEPAAPATGTPTAEGSAPQQLPPRQEHLLGTWVQVYPAPVPPETVGRVIILTPDRKFITAEGTKPLLTGRWTRKDRTFTAEYDAAPGTQPQAPEVRELLTLTSRTLTLRRGNEILVFARP